MTSFFDRLFPRAPPSPLPSSSSSSPSFTSTSPSTKLSSKQSQQKPEDDIYKDPTEEHIRHLVATNTPLHTYTYATELDDYIKSLPTTLADVQKVIKQMQEQQQKEASSKLLLAEQKKKEQGNPKTMWMAGGAGGILGASLAFVLMRKHVEPMTTTVYIVLTSLGAYTGSKLDQKGFISFPSSFT
eukprot:TRINITY_DN1633_c0_g1_i1.p1 TRINITY_DN1633_c0_g1~~TRINITY_DN1633_c0_g1_i1.p1  ORF type:complete len:185 (-),score=65.49 TRINITY_DN1633_c0_g1_i1:28-582(-)